ncbi:galanin receptor 2a [Osmerus eperlanus]|uniref:galanin receptor 2a n=1 Tax=Osmerus eperlanus TaxID=29151 RepID=UPI002E10DE60
MPAIVNLLFNTVSTNTTIPFTMVLPLVSMLSLMVGVVGHLLMWLVLMRNPRRRSKPSSVLLLNLSLADLAALLTLSSTLLSASFQDWQLGGTICVLLGFTTSVTAGVDIFSLAALSVLRYRIVAPPARRPATPKQLAGALALIWLVSITMALPKVTYIHYNGGCSWSIGLCQRLAFVIPAFLVYYIVPLVCIGRNCSHIIAHLHSCRGTLISDRRNKKATALLVGSTLVFAISWLPYYVLEFVNLVPFHGFTSPPTPPPPSPYPFLPTPSPTHEPVNEVSILWEVASLSAILLVCFAPCWNPPLYFLFTRTAVRQLRNLLPSSCKRLRGPAIVRRVGPAPPLCLPRSSLPLPLIHNAIHHTVTHAGG